MADTSTRERRDSDNVRRDIERTRSRMDETVDALADRFSPNHLIDEAWGRIRGQGDEGIGQVVKEHPIPVALVGVGLGWLAVEQATHRDKPRGDGDDPEPRMGHGERPTTYAEGAAQTYDAGASSASYAVPSPGAQEAAEHEHELEGDSGRDVGDRIADAASTVKEKVSSATDSVRERASHAVDSARDTAREKTGRARDRMSHAGESMEDRVRHRGQQARHGFWSMLEENPLALGAVALGIGLASGLSVPSTRLEDRALGHASDAFEDEARRVGERAVERARHVAGEAAATAMEETERMGETTTEDLRRRADPEGRARPSG